ncbi:MAG TPA: replication-relaxation family protein [Acidimicrobiales bacterium]|nr:replication-relaxation family protein [Acidimicrobiales bacterium]
MASAVRRRIDDRLVLEAAGRLTERDRYLCRLLADHQVLTTEQIRSVGFDSQRRTQLRLSQLRQLRVLDRFQPLARIGSAPQHWILDTLGSLLLAAEKGIDPSELAWRRDKAIALATNAQLAHLVGTNGIFCSLLAAARHQPGSDLVLWWSARRCAGAWGTLVRPDGYGVWSESDRRVAFLLEYDNGTETTARLAEKLERYARLFAATGRRLPVLFAFPAPGREAEAHRALRHPDVPAATASLTPGQSPADPVWLPVGSDRARLGLIDLDRMAARDGRG